MQDESLQASRRRERVAPNLYRRRTKDGVERFDAIFRDADHQHRTVALKAKTQRAAEREAPGAPNPPRRRGARRR